MGESYYKIVKDKLQLSDPRFDEYRNESIKLFSDAELGSENSVGRINEEEKNILNKLVGKPKFMWWFLLNKGEKVTLKNMEKQRTLQIKEIDNFNVAIENCRHKMQAVRYSFSLIKNEIKNPVFPIYKALPINLSETEYINDVILFELESFLLQVYSSLDVLIHLLKIFYPCLDNEKEHLIGFKGKGDKAGGKTIEILQKNGGEKEKVLADFFEKEVNAWIQEVRDLRNMVAHKSKVHGIQLFVLDNKKNILHLPILPNGKEVFAYCNDTQQNLFSLFQKISKDFLSK